MFPNVNYNFKNSLLIHEEKTKEITTVSVVLYVINMMIIYINMSLHNVYF